MERGGGWLVFYGGLGGPGGLLTWFGKVGRGDSELLVENGYEAGLRRPVAVRCRKGQEGETIVSSLVSRRLRYIVKGSKSPGRKRTVLSRLDDMREWCNPTSNDVDHADKLARLGPLRCAWRENSSAVTMGCAASAAISSHRSSHHRELDLHKNSNSNQLNSPSKPDRVLQRDKRCKRWMEFQKRQR